MAHDMMNKMMAVNSMVVKNTFSMTDGQLVAMGVIDKGTVKSGDEVEIAGEGKSIKVTIAGLKMWGEELTTAKAGDEVGISFQGLDREQVQAGMVIQSLN